LRSGLDNLSLLFSSLRSAGLRVGVAEELRARYVLLHTPLPDDLAAVLAALVAKSAAEVTTFREVFKSWVEATRRQAVPGPVSHAPPRPMVVATGASTPLLSAKAAVPAPPPTGRGRRRPAFRRTTLRALYWTILTAMAAVGVLWVAVRVVPLAWQTGDALLARFAGWKAGAAPSSAAQSSAWFLMVAFVLAGAVIWVFARRANRLPEIFPGPKRRGPNRILGGIAPRRARLHLLTGREKEHVAWAIERFVTDEWTEQLDATATVRRTADAAGRPVLVYKRRTRQRELWLWSDEAANALATGSGETMERLALELTAALTEVGVTVERSRFTGVPDRLFSDKGELAPADVADRSASTVILVMTDGRGLSRALASASESTRTAALLRALSAAPRLAFVDFSRSEFSLSALLAPFGIAVVAPEQVPQHIGGEGHASPRDRRPAPPAELWGDTAAWAAACALGPQPVDEETVLELRDALALEVSPYQIDRLRAAAPGPGRRLSWPIEQRAHLLGWLVRADVGDGSPPLVRGGLLDRVLGFWRERLRREHEQRSAEDARQPWINTPAEQHHRIEQALLQLWHEPAEAARTLYQLSGGPHRETILRRLRELAASDMNADWPSIGLPWRWSSQSRLTRALLASLGFAGTTSDEKLRLPGRVHLALGICVGFVVSAVAALVIGP
jgi:hypothetical protein